MRFKSLMRIMHLAVILLAVNSIAASAQVPDGVGNSSKSIFNVQKPSMDPRSMSLLDPERFSMKQTYMMNFSSTGGDGGIMGMYINSMEYRFNAPLILRLKVAYQTQTGMMFGQRENYGGPYRNEQGRLFIPSFDLVYTPFKNTTFGISYRDYSGMNRYGANPYSPYNRYAPYRDPFFGGFEYGLDRHMYNLLYGYDQFDHAPSRR